MHVVHLLFYILYTLTIVTLRSLSGSSHIWVIPESVPVDCFIYCQWVVSRLFLYLFFFFSFWMLGTICRIVATDAMYFHLKMGCMDSWYDISTGDFVNLLSGLTDLLLWLHHCKGLLSGARCGVWNARFFLAFLLHPAVPSHLCHKVTLPPFPSSRGLLFMQRTAEVQGSW